MRLKEDRRACLAAGCDDYLTKPIERDRLVEILARFLPTAEAEATEPPAVTAEAAPVDKDDNSQTPGRNDATTEPVIAWEQLITRIGDEDLARELMPVCLQDNKSRLESLREAVAAQDAAQVKLYAHAMKGSSANLGAEPLAQAAKTSGANRRNHGPLARGDLPGGYPGRVRTVRATRFSA